MQKSVLMLNKTVFISPLEKNIKAGVYEILKKENRQMNQFKFYDDFLKELDKIFEDKSKEDDKTENEEKRETEE